MRPGYLPGLVTGFLVALALACSASSPTGATAFQYPADLAAAVHAAQPQVQARYPGCTLAGWTLETRPLPWTPPTGTLCGTTVCTGRVRGYTSFDAQRITVWEQDPHLVAALAWELCNACRNARGVDEGCA